MDLLKAVQIGSLEKIKKIVLIKGIPINSKWLDYAVLNSALESGRKEIAKFLVDRGCRVNKVTKSLVFTNTPLHHAVRLGDLEIVNTLLEKKASVVAVNAERDTPLHLAFMIRNNQLIDALLPHIVSSKIDNFQNNHGLTFMHIACARNEVEIASNFLDKGVNIDISVNDSSPLWAGYTPLHFAIEFKCLDIVKYLLNTGANKYIYNAKGLTPIDLSKQNFREVSLIDYFISGDNRDNESSYYNKISNFHVACMRDDPPLVESFIKNGACINNPIYKDAVYCPLYTPLHFAVESNCKRNVELLVDQDADVERQNNYYMTPIHLALYNEDHKSKNTIVDLLYSALKNKEADRTDLNGLTYFHIACTRNNVKIVEQFLKKGEDPDSQILYNLRNFAHYTPLHFAVKYKCKEIVHLLIKYNANVNRSDYGMDGTPIHLAVENGDADIIDILLKNGARTNVIRPYDDKTVLHLLIEQILEKTSVFEDKKNIFIEAMFKEEHIYENYIRKFVKLGCDINAKDSDGNTALHLACSNIKNGISCVRILLDCGADINIENAESKTPFENSFHHKSWLNVDHYIMHLYHHVQKLKTLGLKVNSKNEKCCVEILKGKNECDQGADYFTEKDMNKKQNQREDEIAKMKSTTIDRRTLLYDILFMDSKRLAFFAQNKVFKDIIKSDDFTKQYPSYGYLLRLQYLKGLDNEEPKYSGLEMADMRERRSKRLRIR